MAYTVAIEYKGVEQELEKICAPIMRLFQPNNSYIDTPAYTEGIPADKPDDEKISGKSVYATNVDGWGSLDMAEPFATTSVPMSGPLAQFKLAVVGEDNKVEFEVDDYKEAFYYQQLGDQMADQGFVVTVTKK